VKISRQKIKSSRVEGEDQGALDGIVECRNDDAPVRCKRMPLLPLVTCAALGVHIDGG